MSNPYFNTTKLKHQHLASATTKAKTQDELVLQFFKERPNREFTPAEAHATMMSLGMISQQVPLTSIRRSITNNTPPLTKTETKKPGMYGHDNFCWKYIAEEKKNLSLFD